VVKKSPIQIAAKLHKDGYISYGKYLVGFFAYNPMPGKDPEYIHITEPVYRILENFERKLNKESSQTS
jgi:hypothetical protein